MDRKKFCLRKEVRICPGSQEIPFLCASQEDQALLSSNSPLSSTGASPDLGCQRERLLQKGWDTLTGTPIS